VGEQPIFSLPTSDGDTTGPALECRCCAETREEHIVYDHCLQLLRTGTAQVHKAQREGMARDREADMLPVGSTIRVFTLPADTPTSHQGTRPFGLRSLFKVSAGTYV